MSKEFGNTVRAIAAAAGIGTALALSADTMNPPQMFCLESFNRLNPDGTWDRGTTALVGSRGIMKQALTFQKTEQVESIEVTRVFRQWIFSYTPDGKFRAWSGEEKQGVEAKMKQEDAVQLFPFDSSYECLKGKISDVFLSPPPADVKFHSIEIDQDPGVALRQIRKKLNQYGDREV